MSYEQPTVALPNGRKVRPSALLAGVTQYGKQIAAEIARSGQPAEGPFVDLIAKLATVEPASNVVVALRPPGDRRSPAGDDRRDSAASPVAGAAPRVARGGV